MVVFGFFSGFEHWTIASEDILPPFRESEAYQRYIHRPRTEFTKLLYLVDRFHNADLEILYEGRPYRLSNFTTAQVILHILKHYRMETAEAWIGLNTYRSSPGGRIIQVRYPGGKLRPARDVLLEELKTLQSV